MRGTTRNCMGAMPMVVRASISSLTVMVPSWAAKADPGPPGEDDGGDERPDFAGHRDADEVSP